MKLRSEKIRILIVEDEIPTAMAMTALLTSAGYDTRVAMTGTRAIKMAQEGDFDLITLDVDLPDMNGYEVCSHLKENPFFQTPIVFVSGRPLEQDIQRGLKLGAVDYIAKPFEPFEFKKRLLSHVKSAETLNDILASITKNAESGRVKVLHGIADKVL